MTEPPTFGRARRVPSSRITRATRLGSMAARVAGNMAANSIGEISQGNRPRLRHLLLTPGNLRRITDELAGMRGAAMKLAQLISMDSGELLPPELAEIMARLRAEADFMPPKQLKTVLNEAWGPDWLRAFHRFDVRPIAAASIGQVHRAQLEDGRDLAIKVQYPGVARSIDSDVANVASLIKISGLIPNGFDLAPYIEEARLQLHRETDYAAEAQALEEFGRHLASDHNYLLPEVVHDWTRPNILAMSFVENTALDALENAPQSERDRVAHQLFALCLTELFSLRIMQTDPNPANFGWNTKTEQLVLLDFGATRSFPQAFVEKFRALIAAGLSGDLAEIETKAVDMGFWDQETNPELSQAMRDMIALVFKEISAEPLFDFGKTVLIKTLHDRGLELSSSKHVPPPMPIDSLFLQRKFAGMFLIASRLRARVPITRMLSAYLRP